MNVSAEQRHRKAHKVAVQVTAPNGFNDRSKTEDDRIQDFDDCYDFQRAFEQDYFEQHANFTL